MSTLLHDSPIFGPIKSRRLGTSLGINLLPATGKVCTFDCIYCECGRNAERKTQEALPTKDVVLSALKEKLLSMLANNEAPDVFTFAGNGEPTAHPQFAQILEGVRALRDEFFPNAKISVLSNGTQVHKPHVFEALKTVDNNILKLDAVDDRYIAIVDRPASHYKVEEQIQAYKRFDGRVTVQTLFMTGVLANGFDVDNTTEKYVAPWLCALEAIKPASVMIYTIDRETPDENLKKATPKVLDAIAERVRALGIAVSVSY